MNPALNKPRLHTLLGDYPNTRALKSAALNSDVLEFDFVEAKVPNQSFKRVVREFEFDIAELAIVTFLQAKSYGKPLVLLPAVVGPGRFQHQCLIYNPERGHLDPSKLAGKRVGMRSYAQTTPAWIRGILQRDYAVDLDSIHWVGFEDGHLAEYKDPPRVERAGKDKQLLPMLLAGELDAIIVGNDAPEDARLKPVIAEPLVAAKAWCDKHQAVPVNHLMVVRETLSRDRPDVVREVHRLLMASKARSGGVAQGATDFFPFGVEACRPSLEIIIEYAFAQGLLARSLTVDELFDDTTGAL